MGRLTDGSINIYGKGREQIDVATQNRLNNPNGSHTTLGILGTALLPNLLSGIACQVADSNCGGAGSSVSKSNSQEVTPESLKKEIETKLAEVGFEGKTVEDINNELTALQSPEHQLSQAVATAQAALDGQVQNFNNNQLYLDSNKNAYDAAIAKPDAERTPQEKELIEAYELCREANQNIKDNLIPEAEKQLEAAQNAKSDRIGELQDAKRVLEPLVKQLQELELTNAVDQYKNKESKKILSLIKKINSETDQNKRVQLVRELGAAVEAYYANHKEGECPTIDNLPAAKNYLKVKNFKPDTTQLDERVNAQQAELFRGLGFGQRKVS